jgi:hypothetical protein
MGGLGGELWDAMLFGDVCAGYAAILTWKRTAYVMKYEPADESLELTAKVAAGSTRSGAMGVDGDRSSGASVKTVVPAVPAVAFPGIPR